MGNVTCIWAHHTPGLAGGRGQGTRPQNPLQDARPSSGLELVLPEEKEEEGEGQGGAGPIEPRGEAAQDDAQAL